MSDTLVSYGMFKDGKRKGLMIEDYFNGNKYEGRYGNGDRLGFGKYAWTDGSSYEGNWKDSN